MRGRRIINTTDYGTTMTGTSGVNGDSFYISDNKKVFILSDGASGAGSNGKVLMSNTCIEEAKNYDYLTSKLDAKNYVDTLFWKINNKLIEISQESRQLAYGTIIIAVVDKATLTVTTFGDSPAYLMTAGKIKRVARNKKRYEDMIEDGFITTKEYEDYTKQMHERMWCCFDYFLPEVVPNNIIEQYHIEEGDMFFMCCDGLSDWILPVEIFKRINKDGIKAGVDNLICQAKEKSLADHNSFDDITAIALSFQ